MPAKKPTPDGMPSKELVLAAIERAQIHRLKHDDHGRRQRNPDPPGVLLASIKDHLGLTRHGWTTIRLRPIWSELQAAGLIEHSRAHGKDVWRLTTTGRKRLQRARHAGEVDELPESPQHQQWREARAIASERIGEFGEMLQTVLSEAASLFDNRDSASSDAWHTLSQRLRRACARLESANYCLHEWPEPPDSQPDIVPRGKAALRSIRRFDND